MSMVFIMWVLLLMTLVLQDYFETLIHRRYNVIYSTAHILFLSVEDRRRLHRVICNIYTLDRGMHKVA